MDDILEYPGVAVGDYVIATCEAGVSPLGATGGDWFPDAPFILAAELFAAELDTSVGSESCPAAEEPAIAGHVVLSAAEFEGAPNHLLRDPAVRRSSLPFALASSCLRTTGVPCVGD